MGGTACGALPGGWYPVWPMVVHEDGASSTTTGGELTCQNQRADTLLTHGCESHTGCCTVDDAPSHPWRAGGRRALTPSSLTDSDSGCSPGSDPTLHGRSLAGRACQHNGPLVCFAAARVAIHIHTLLLLQAADGRQVWIYCWARRVGHITVGQDGSRGAIRLVCTLHVCLHDKWMLQVVLELCRS